MLLLGHTWRIERLGLAERDARLAQSERCIFAFWHARLLPLVFAHRGRGAAVLISRHRDGEWIARIIQRMGYVTARGSSTRGGEEGVRDMLSLAESGRTLGISPDGPRGPAEVAKLGTVFIAGQTGIPVIPVASAGRPVWMFRSWDRFRVPIPFAKVVVVYGDPIVVPTGLDAAGLEAWRVRLDAALHEVTARAERGIGTSTS